jgi:hypothetical protein
MMWLEQMLMLLAPQEMLLAMCGSFLPHPLHLRRLVIHPCHVLAM